MEKTNKTKESTTQEDKRQNEIIRIQKKQNNFVMLDKGFLEDNRLSFKAKGILAYLLSKPDNWKVIVKDLINHSADGKKAIYSGLRELKKYGYYKKIPVRDESNKFISHWESVIYECPNEQSEQQQQKTNKKPKKPDKNNEIIRISPLFAPYEEILNDDIPNEYIPNGQRNNINHNQNKPLTSTESINQVNQKDEPPIQDPTLDDSVDNTIINTEHISDTPINIFDNPMNIPKIVAGKIHLDELKTEHVNQESEITELYNIVCQVLTTYNAETIRIAKQNVNITTVKQAFSLLDKSHFEYILFCLSKNYKISGNPKNYFITTLFNSVRTKPFFNSYNDRYSHKNKEKSKYEIWFEEKIKRGY